MKQALWRDVAIDFSKRIKSMRDRFLGVSNLIDLEVRLLKFMVSDYYSLSDRITKLEEKCVKER